MTRPDLPEVNARLAANMEAMARHLIGTEPTHRGRETWRFRAKGSLAVVVAGARRGEWMDHEAGQGGDALGLVAHMLHMPMRDAYRWALAWLGDGPAPSAPAKPETPPARAVAPDTLDLARRVWRERQPIDGTPAAAYLASRGLRPEPGAPLAYHPACPRGGEKLPAMLALMTDAETGEPCGVHRTFILHDGSAKAPPGPRGEPAKMMCGAAGIIRLTPDADVTTGLGIAEGIETSLAVMQAFGWRPVWAACSAGAIARFPVLRGIEALTVFADPDGPGLTAARACCERWAAAGREARILAPPAGAGDFNDLARERAA
ncbi:MAG: toprim domain-containing protein [Alphaproteobacteria bacterium]|nr:toprim domain-containing protein [Alphaproteobacteria bacterium]